MVNGTFTGTGIFSFQTQINLRENSSAGLEARSSSGVSPLSPSPWTHVPSQIGRGRARAWQTEVRNPSVRGRVTRWAGEGAAWPSRDGRYVLLHAP